MKKDCIIIDGIEYIFIPEKNPKKECCEICSLKEICFARLKPENLICNIHINPSKGIVNGYYKLNEIEK
ncbi:hypothetical protein SJC03_248 [Bacteroides phage SJC03]|nr:hypothetical protein SJC03_248 [Bacteroides phage SJC03]